MNGGHRLVYDFILANSRGNETVLDIGAGASHLAEWLTEKGCLVIAMDIDKKRLESINNRKYQIAIGDATTPDIWRKFPDAVLDLVIAKYSIQHMIGSQCFVWSHAARVLRPGGRFIHSGRYRQDAPVIEADRQDPLLANNEITIAALAMNSGLMVVGNKLYSYSGDEFGESRADTANAMISVMVKP